jgi:hypothetical protein
MLVIAAKQCDQTSLWKLTQKETKSKKSTQDLFTIWSHYRQKQCKNGE